MVDDREAAAVFDAQRPRLLRIAYRMLGSLAEAEDVVQDAWLRWHQADRASVRDPAAFLARTVSRLSLDVLKSARVRREAYVGPWLPEPILVTEEEPEDDVTLTLMMALERLSPLERAAFLLHDVFGMAFEEVAVAIDRDAAACRQLAARARAHVRGDSPRFPVPKEKGLSIASAFFDASRSGDVSALKGLLAADVVVHSDGGGKRVAAQKPVIGEAVVTRFFAHWAEKAGYRRPPVLHMGLIDGLPGYVTEEADGIQVTAFAIEGERIAAIYVIRNPDKLERLAARFGRA
jgi:RNA polymerase sigma-70 factor (ECF subfamily)